MNQRIAPWLMVFALGACAHSRPHGELAYPLMDGRCDEFPSIAQARHEIAEGVTLYQFQDRHYVWFCYTIPEGNFGTMDMQVSAPALEAPLNLHVSAQLGEWRVDRPGDAPADPQSERWWNHHGWSGFWTGFNGFEKRPGRDGESPRFRTHPGREIQLDKRRFGRGEWRWSIEIRGIPSVDGQPRTLRYPDRGESRLEVD